MGFGLLAPLFLAGMGMIALPYWLHHIRRPEREPVVFGSLMFVPAIRKEVIERRRLQHLMLLLLRVGILVLLALAFARPVWYYEPALSARGESLAHVILIDQSYSMATGSRMDRAKEAAHSVLADIGAEAPLVIAGFSDRTQILRAFDDPRSPVDETAAIDSLSPHNTGTRYSQVMQRVASLLQEHHFEETSVVVHTISDFQLNGMPPFGENVRLPSYAQLDLIDMAEPTGFDASVRDVYIDALPTGEYWVRGMIEVNEPPSTNSVRVTLFIENEAVDTQTIRFDDRLQVPVQFSWEPSADLNRFHGWLELSEDTNPVNNRRFFAEYTPASQPLLLVADETDQDTIPGNWFVQRAIESDPNSRWDITKVSASGFDPGAFAVTPDVILLTDGAVATMGDNVPEGIPLLIFCGDTRGDTSALLDRFGIQVERFIEMNQSDVPFAQLSWVKFRHPVFQSFQDSQYNDFSALRFRQFVSLSTSAAAEPSTEIIARMDAETTPVILAGRDASGTGALVFGFEPNLDWSSLPRSPKFVALLLESLRHLGGEPPRIREWIVGGQSTPPDESMEWSKQFSPMTEVSGWGDANPGYLEAPGILRWTKERRMIDEAVNVDPIESDLNQVSLDEFRERFVAFEAIYSATDSDEEESIPERDDWMGMVIALLALAVLTETWAATRLTP